MFCCSKMSRSAGLGNSPLFWIWLSYLKKSGMLCFNTQTRVKISYLLSLHRFLLKSKNTLTGWDIIIHLQVLKTSDVTVNTIRDVRLQEAQQKTPTSSSYLPDSNTPWPFIQLVLREQVVLENKYLCRLLAGKNYNYMLSYRTFK